LKESGWYNILKKKLLFLNISEMKVKQNLNFHGFNYFLKPQEGRSLENQPL